MNPHRLIMNRRDLSFHWCHTNNCLNHLLTDDVDCTVAIAPGQKLKSSISAKCSSNYECDGESSICQDTGNVVSKFIREYRVVKQASTVVTGLIDLPMTKN